MTSTASSSAQQTPATAGELQTIVAARSLADKHSCFIGVGRPSTAAILARMIHNPDLVLVNESGTIGAKPYRGHVQAENVRVLSADVRGVSVPGVGLLVESAASSPNRQRDQDCSFGLIPAAAPARDRRLDTASGPPNASGAGGSAVSISEQPGPAGWPRNWRVSRFAHR